MSFYVISGKRHILDLLKGCIAHLYRSSFNLKLKHLSWSINCILFLITNMKNSVGSAVFIYIILIIVETKLLLDLSSLILQ